MPAPAFWSASTLVGPAGVANIDALLGGTRWTSASITYSFPSQGAIWGTSFSTGYGASGEPWSAAYEPLSESDRGYFTSAIQQWGNVANLHFTLVADTSTSVGDIRAAYSAGGDATQAWAYLPDNASIAGDVWFNSFGTSASEVWTTGSYEYLTVLHELGHALGLKHPFQGTAVLPLGLDSKSFTVMSYSGENGNASTRMSFYPTTPMILDIDAMQHLYGANTAYHSGDDSYAYSDSTRYNETIWDAGGNDSIEYTASSDADIDLRAGVAHGSRIGLPVYVTSHGVKLHAIDNVWIADGAVIENASSGSGDDTLTGNDAANSLDGGPGRDSIKGGDGTDTLYGGYGNDRLAGNKGADAFVFDSMRSASANQDTIVDFRPAEHDQIWLDHDIFTKLGTLAGVTRLGAGRFSGDGVAHDSNDNVLYDPSTGALFYDRNGDAAGGATVIAMLGIDTHPLLHYTDFQIIG